MTKQGHESQMSNETKGAQKSTGLDAHLNLFVAHKNLGFLLGQKMSQRLCVCRNNAHTLRFSLM